MEKNSIKKLFIVDDDADVLIVLKHCFQKDKTLEVVYLSSGQEAIKQALLSPPDLFLIDVMMPEMDGIATLKAIRLIPGLAHIPIIFFTAKVQKEEISEYFKLGVADVITKPFDPIHLVETVKQIWEKI